MPRSLAARSRGRCCSSPSPRPCRPAAAPARLIVQRRASAARRRRRRRGRDRRRRSRGRRRRRTPRRGGSRRDTTVAARLRRMRRAAVEVDVPSVRAIPDRDDVESQAREQRGTAVAVVAPLAMSTARRAPASGPAAGSSRATCSRYGSHEVARGDQRVRRAADGPAPIGHRRPRRAARSSSPNFSPWPENTLMPLSP